MIVSCTYRKYITRGSSLSKIFTVAQKLFSVSKDELMICEKKVDQKCFFEAKKSLKSLKIQHMKSFS